MRAALTRSAPQDVDSPSVRLTPEAFAKPPGGVRRTALGLLAALREAGAPVSASTFVEEAISETSPTPSALRRGMLQVAEARFFATRRLHRERGVAHSLYYDQQLRLADWPLVVTVNDMIHERFGAGSQALRWAKRSSVSRASVVITPSIATASDVVRFFPEVAGRVVTIPWAISAPFLTEPHRRSTEVDRPYLLYVGARAGYKNFGILGRALAGAQDLGEFRLVLAGGGPFREDEERSLVDQLSASDRFVQVMSPRDEALRGLYDDAAALVVTSRCEGFGLPLLEAMARGCPVAAADGGSTAEIADGHAAIFPPDSTEACADAIRRAIAMPSALREAARAHAARFNWEATAEAHIDVYRSVQRAPAHHFA